MKTLFRWFLDWLKDLLISFAKKKVEERREEEKVDDIVDRAKDPDLGKAVDATDDLEDEFNRNT